MWTGEVVSGCSNTDPSTTQHGSPEFSAFPRVQGPRALGAWWRVMQEGLNPQLPGEPQPPPASTGPARGRSTSCRKGDSQTRSHQFKPWRWGLWGWRGGPWQGKGATAFGNTPCRTTGLLPKSTRHVGKIKTVSEKTSRCCDTGERGVCVPVSPLALAAEPTVHTQPQGHNDGKQDNHLFSRLVSSASLRGHPHSRSTLRRLHRETEPVLD